MKLDKLAKTAVAALEGIKGRDIVVLDVKRMTSLFDTMIVVGADSNRQGRALSSSLQERVKALGARVYGVEGEQVGEWILVDLGSVIVHVMQHATRKHYNLEELWAPPQPRAKRQRARKAAKQP